MRVWRSASVAETHAVGVGLAGELQPRGCLLLYGALGAGKTVLAQGVAEGLGIDPRAVQSPTRVIFFCSGLRFISPENSTAYGHRIRQKAPWP